MRILITNDDGIRAEGIQHLANTAKKFGKVKIFAPDRERSACSHAISATDPMRVKQIDWDGAEAYEVTGYPADCIHLGLNLGWPDGCDLILSGINNGPNLGLDVTYSGTVAGAIEGTICGIRSIALSMAPLQYNTPMMYEIGAEWLKNYWQKLVNLPLKKHTLLNINIPSIPYAQLKEPKIVEVGHRIYRHHLEPRQDGWGRKYFWHASTPLTCFQHEVNTDIEMVSLNHVAITPLTLDWTDYEHMKLLQEHFIS